MGCFMSLLSLDLTFIAGPMGKISLSHSAGDGGKLLALLCYCIQQLMSVSFRMHCKSQNIVGSHVDLGLEYFRINRLS